jgi:hypothetical protein
VDEPRIEVLMDEIYAPAELRDRFLNALDAKDAVLCDRLAFDLKSCVNPLPGMACEQLGLPLRSTYGAAARLVLATSREPKAGIQSQLAE